MILLSEIKEELRHLGVRIDIALRQRIGKAVVVLSFNDKVVRVWFEGDSLISQVVYCDSCEEIVLIEDKVAILEAFDLKYPVGSGHGRI